MVGFNFRATFQDESWIYLDGISAFQLVPVGDEFRLYAGSGAYGGVIGFNLSAGLAATHIGDWSINGGGNAFRLSDLALVDQDGGQIGLIASELGSNHLERYDFNASGNLTSLVAPNYSGSVPSTTTQLVSFTSAGIQYVATGGGAGGSAGLDIYEVQGSTFVHRDTVLDHIKVTVGDIADLITVNQNDITYLVAGSAEDGGISTFSIDPNGHVHLIDAIGAKEGLWLSGLDTLTSTEAGGVSYIIVGATNSSSLSVVRINQMGVLFVTDHITDNLNTRFANVDAIDSFSVNGRGFVIAGGSDDGLSLFEIMPDGHLIAHSSIENRAGWNLENITTIQSVVTAEEVQVFASGGSTPGIMQFAIPTSALSSPLTGDRGNNSLHGAGQADLVSGGVGDDALYGHAGDDILFGGAGRDALIGGTGADIFVFDESLEQDQIWDFELGIDRIDLSRWGMIYSPSSLTISSHSNGATLYFGDHSLRIWTEDNSALTTADLTIDTFIF